MRREAPNFAPNRVYLNVGKPGCGKSSVSRLLVKRLLVESPDSVALVHDPNPVSAEHRGYGERYRFASPQAFTSAQPGQRGRLNVFSGPFRPELLAPMSIQMGRHRPVILAYDELDLVVRDGQLVDGGQQVEYDGVQGSPLYQVANYGRHKRVALVGTARRAPATGPLFQSACEGIFVLRLDSSADMNWCASIEDRGFAKKVASLQKYEGYYRSDQGIRHFRVSPTELTWD